jgi:hypothetical protein
MNISDHLEFWIVAFLKLSVIYKVLEISEWTAHQVVAGIRRYRIETEDSGAPGDR